MSDSVNARRIARDAALDSAFVGKSYRILRSVRLSDSSPKFHAWISGARGRNGYEIVGDDGIVRIVGRTTLDDAHERDAIVNYVEFLAEEEESDRRARIRVRPAKSDSKDAKDETDMGIDSDFLDMIAEISQKVGNQA